jgi:hypothetical protein
VPPLFRTGRGQRCRSTRHWQATTATSAILIVVGLHPDPNPVAAWDRTTCRGVLRRYNPWHGRRMAGVLIDGEQLGIQRDVMSHYGREAHQRGDDGRFFA